MVSAKGWLAEEGIAAGKKTREKNRGFDLSTGRRQSEIYAGQLPAFDDQGGKGISPSARDIGAHQPQRLNQPVHGATTQGNVAGDDGEERSAGQKTAKQTHGSGTILGIEHIGSFFEAIFTCS